MPRLAVSMNDSQYDWLESQADSRGVSMAELVRRLIDAGRADESLLNRGLIRDSSGDSSGDSLSDSQADSPSDSLRARVDELEERLDDLEAGIPAGSSDDKRTPSENEERRESDRPPEAMSGSHQSDDGPERAESAQQAGSVDAAAGDSDADGTGDEADDTDGQGDGEAVPALQDVDFPARRDRNKCEAAILAVRDHLREQGPTSMREIVTAVMPEHPIGYDVPELKSGDRYRGSWWRKIVKPGLKALPDVEAPESGASKWRYTGSE